MWRYRPDRLHAANRSMDEIKASCQIVACPSIWFRAKLSPDVRSLRRRFFDHLPRALIDLNGSMSGLPCSRQPRNMPR
jgi:hypothetical protein